MDSAQPDLRLAQEGNQSMIELGVYTRTFLLRSENFLYQQATGLESFNPSFLAFGSANRDEFPAGRVVCARARRFSYDHIIAGVRRRLRRQPHPGWIPAYAVARLARVIEKIRFPLCYTMFSWNALTLQEVIQKSGAGSRMVFHAAGSDITTAEHYGSDYIEHLRRLFLEAHLVLAGSDFLRQKVIALGCDERKVRTHYIGVPASPMTQRPPANPEHYTFVAVSRLHPVKGVAYTIRSFAQAAKVVPGLRLKIIGDGELRFYCEELARELCAPGSVTFSGSLSHAEALRAMGKADAFVQHNVRTPTGHEEALGGSILEAGSWGLPVVVTRSGGIPEIVNDADVGTLVEERDVDAMASAMIKLAQDPVSGQRQGLALRQRVLKRFNLSRQNHILNELLLSSVGRV